MKANILSWREKNFLCICSNMQNTVAARLNAGDMGSNPAQGMYIYVWLF
jgi:hypothetical protein